MNAIIPTYPGTGASPTEILALADHYRSAAYLLMGQAKRRQPLSLAPSRLCAIHAIELYLNAFLLVNGTSPEKVRGHLHDLQARAELAHTAGLVLRRRTAEHLARMTREREYIVSRYGPEMFEYLSEITRLIASLEEVATKVARIVSPTAVSSPTCAVRAPVP